MTTNVITFPSRKEETVEIESTMAIEEAGNDFAYEVMEHIHDILHDQTGECLFTDDQYKPLAICLGEVLTALYMFSQGNETHPFYEIAQEIFGDEALDISDKEVYTGDNVNNEET
jgi:hypothetical protein